MLKRLFRHLPAYGFLILRLITVYSIVFLCFRILFCLFNVPDHNGGSFTEYLHAFWMGFRFDLNIISFMLMLPALVLFLHHQFFNDDRYTVVIMKWYLFIVSLFVFFIASSDIPYFSQFGNHINKSVTVWRLSADYTFKLVFSSFYYWGFFLLFIVSYVLTMIAVSRILREYRRRVNEEGTPPYWKNALLFLITAFCLFAFARGRLASKSTMHEGMSIVGSNAFINQIALNPNYTLARSLSRKEEDQHYLKNIDRDLKRCASFYDQNYFPGKMPLKAPILSATPADSLRKFNVVVVLMESMSMSKMGYHKNKNLSPYMTELAKKSVFFDRFFSSGIHTFNGLFSTASGFPSIYTEQGLRQYTKEPFTTLANLLKPYGYQSYFCTTHDAVFDNMEGFFKLNGFDKLISESDFAMTENLGVTGVPDHKLFAKLIETVNKTPQERFVAYVMTGTDHGPWHIPSDIPFRPDGGSFQDNASMYADWAIKQFIEEAEKTSWYKETIFVFLGDHGQLTNDPYQMPITYHHIPCIVHCPALLKPEVNHHLGYQPDVVKTVASLLKLDYDNFSFGENILEKDRPFVFFSADDKLAYITSDDYFFYNCLSDGQKHLVKYMDLDETDHYAEQQHRSDSLYDVMQSLYNSARFYLHQNYSAY